MKRVRGTNIGLYLINLVAHDRPALPSLSGEQFNLCMVGIEYFPVMRLHSLGLRYVFHEKLQMPTPREGGEMPFSASSP